MKYNFKIVDTIPQVPDLNMIYILGSPSKESSMISYLKENDAITSAYINEYAAYSNISTYYSELPENLSALYLIYNTDDVKLYIPIAVFGDIKRYSIFTYDEQLTASEHNQYNLSFNIAKYVNGEENPFLSSMAEGRKLQFRQSDDIWIDFIIKETTPVTDSNNVIYNIVAQDFFSYSLTTKSVGMSINTFDDTGFQYIDNKEQIVERTENSANPTVYKKLDPLLDTVSSGPFNIMELIQLVFYKSFIRDWRINIRDAFDTQYEDTPVNIKVSYDNDSTTPYNALVDICNLFNALLLPRYQIREELPFKIAIDNQWVYDFNNKTIKAFSASHATGVVQAFAQVLDSTIIENNILLPRYTYNEKIYVRVSESQWREEDKTDLTDFNTAATLLTKEYRYNSLVVIDKNKLINKGFNLRPDVNMTAFSYSSNITDFCTVMHVSGGEDEYDIPVTVVPNMPDEVRDWLGKNDYKALTTEEIQQAINSKDIEVNKFFNVFKDYIPSFSSTIYNFDYLYKNNIMSKNQYDRLVDNKTGIFPITLRNLNLEKYLVSPTYNAMNFDLQSTFNRYGLIAAQIAAEQNLQFNILTGQEPLTMFSGTTNLQKSIDTEAALKLSIAGVLDNVYYSNYGLCYGNEKMVALRDELNKKGVEKTKQYNDDIIAARKILIQFDGKMYDGK